MSITPHLRKHSVSIRGHATSYTLEDPFFEIIEEIAGVRGLSVAALVAEVDSKRDRAMNLSSALRLCALDWLKSKVSPTS
ncbi:ribbon-helix-helix domain-containing protein [Ochrobactrum sp. CM-21-5]|nr:ribbon-helix-helix domain-containing protein [Ochrobactrum sp. CM-21-5]MBC2885912.1 ribbon-helix-helix domain-containing protein [Ochrobactrum sp. CM-21-5]